MDLVEKKAAQRKTAFGARKLAHGQGLDDAAILRLRAEIGPVEGKIIAGYMPIRTEVDPLPAMIALAEANRICVPVIEGKGQPLKFREWHPDARMVAGEFGASVPEEGEWLDPDIVIVPLVAFDRDCNRLGYGGGFYDRTLEGLRATKLVRAIGFAYGAQEIEGLVLEPTDQPLDALVTEAEVIRPLVSAAHSA